MTAVLRPSYVDKALSSVRYFATRQPTNVYINIDPVGPSSAESVADAARKHYPQAIFRQAEKPSFPLAVKWLWESAESPAIFHVEDSKDLNRTVNVNEMLRGLQDFAAISLKFVNPESNRVGPSNVRARSDGFFQTDYYDKAVCLQPSFWRTEVARTLASFMIDGVSPEKTIRPGKFNPALNEVINYMSQFQFGFVTDSWNEFWYNRRGAVFRNQYGFRKKGKAGTPDTWKKK